MASLQWALLLLLCFTVAARAVDVASGTEDISSGSSAESSSNSDPIQGLINKMMDGNVDPKQLGSDTDARVAMANANEIHKVGQDDAAAEEVSREAATKKSFEAGEKRDREERQKVRSEEREKKVDLNMRHIRSEEKNKEFSDALRLKSEQARKKGMEAERKSQEQAEKQIEAADRAASAVKIQMERERQVQRVKENLSEETSKRKDEMERKEMQEQIRKDDMKAKFKREEEHRKFLKAQMDAKRREVAEKEKGKKAIENQREKHTKAMKAKLEKQAKASKIAFERNEKARRQLPGKWCACESTRTYFDRNNQWHSCPSDKLLTGIYRGSYHNLANIYYFRCCRPCQDKGRQPLKIGSCPTANWVHSFDTTGWSKCPQNTYIRALYKSSCNWIYCLEYAQCCAIRGSKGYQHCNTKSSWASSFDRAGWSIVDGDRFITGFYRSGGHQLYNIEYASQCRYFAFD